MGAFSSEERQVTFKTLLFQTISSCEKSIQYLYLKECLPKEMRMKSPQKKTKKKSLGLDKVYRLLEPGPVVLVSTKHKDKSNVMAMSWHMMVDFVPPLVACVISNQNFTFSLLKKTKECVINIPTVEIAKKVVAIGNTSGRKIDKFKTFDILQESASQVNAALLSECFSNLECKVIDMKMTPKYNIFILEVVKAWISPVKNQPKMIHHCGKGNFVIDGKLIKLPSKMK